MNDTSNEKENQVVIHFMEKTGKITELGRRPNGYLAQIISATEAMALVHDLSLKMIEFSPSGFEQSGSDGFFLPSIIQVLFYRPPESSPFLSISAVIASRNVIQVESLGFIEESGKFLEGILKRESEGHITSSERKKIEIELLSLVESRLFGKVDWVKSKLFVRNLPILPYLNCTYQMVGFVEFPDSKIQLLATCPQNHEFDFMFEKCPYCGSSANSAPQRITFQRISFASLSPQFKPIDLLKFVIPWITVGEKIVRSFVNKLIWPPSFINTLLLPQRMIFHTQKGVYYTTLWNLSKNNLAVALLRSNSSETDQLFKLTLLNHKLGRLNWNYDRVCKTMGLIKVLDREPVAWKINHGNLPQIDETLIEQLSSENLRFIYHPKV